MMKDRDCDFLKPAPPYRATILPEQRHTTADLVRLWAKSGVIHQAPRPSITRGDLIGLIALIASLAFCIGYYAGRF